METAEPIAECELSFVVAWRPELADGDSLSRLRSWLRIVAWLSLEHGIGAEALVVEWGQAPDEPGLADPLALGGGRPLALGANRPLALTADGAGLDPRGARSQGPFELEQGALGG